MAKSNQNLETMVVTCLLMFTSFSIASASFLASAGNGTNTSSCDGVAVALPKVFLSGVKVAVTITLPDYVENMTLNETEVANCPYGNITLMPLPEIMVFEIHHSGKLVVAGNITRDDRTGLSVVVEISGSGSSNLDLYVEGVCESHIEEVYIIPAWLSIFPPILTIGMAIISKQVLVSLVAGIFLGCLFLFQYNPLTAFLRVYDMYLTNAVAEPDHAEILVATILLGGLIGVVQKSGGAYGLARILRQLAKTRRSSLLVTIGMCFLVFFDDYSNILIVGNTLRSVMSASGVSKNKFASVIHSMGPPIASIVPISSWIGVEVGAAKAVLKTLNSTEQPFIFVVSTIPYRFFPMIMLFFPLITAIIGWEFGPMLSAEVAAIDKLHHPSPRSVTNYGTATVNESPVLETITLEQEDDVSAGALDPKKGVPQRWFNAAIPFLIVMIVTFLGMIFGGMQIVHQKGIPATFVNYFGNCDAIAALCWSSALATWVALVMLLVQRIFSFAEFMEAWVVGVKELLEPVLILCSAWALGSIVNDVQASAWVANSIPPSFKVQVIPVLASVLACIMSYATGSAFGTMAILFPLIVPLVGIKDPGNAALLHQAGGAIFGGAIFGNVVAPIADDTILTTLSAPIPLTTHLKSQTPYVLLVVANSLLFGHVMVAFGCYNAYVGLLLCCLSIVATLLLFGQSPQNPKKKPIALKILAFIRRKVGKPQLQAFEPLLPGDNKERTLSCDESTPGL